MKTISIMALLAPITLAGCGGGSSSPEPVPLNDSGTRFEDGQVLDSRVFAEYSDCTIPMLATVEVVGVAPQERDPALGSTRDSATGVLSQTWYYWSTGLGYEFRWSGTIGGCEITGFTFPATL